MYSDLGSLKNMNTDDKDVPYTALGCVYRYINEYVCKQI